MVLFFKGISYDNQIFTIPMLLFYFGVDVSMNTMAEIWINLVNWFWTDSLIITKNLIIYFYRGYIQKTREKKLHSKTWETWKVTQPGTHFECT